MASDQTAKDARHAALKMTAVTPPSISIDATAAPHIAISAKVAAVSAAPALKHFQKSPHPQEYAGG